MVNKPREPHRAELVGPVHHRRVVGGDGHLELPEHRLELRLFRCVDVDDPRQGVDIADGVGHLPFPVVPLGFRHVPEQRNVPVQNGPMWFHG